MLLFISRTTCLFLTGGYMAINSTEEMINQKVTYAELKLNKDSKRQQQKPKDFKSSATVVKQEITYIELNLQNTSQDLEGNDRHSDCKDLLLLPDKLIAIILGLLCLILMVLMIAVISFSETKKSNSSTLSNWTQKSYHCKHCPKEWFRYSNSCYYISNEAKMWNESLMDCSSKNSKLFYIDKEEEMNIFVSLNIIPWIGLSQKNNDSVWMWPDGSIFFPKWFSISTKKQEKCLFVIFSRKEFIPEPCSVKKASVGSSHFIYLNLDN